MRKNSLTLRSYAPIVLGALVGVFLLGYGVLQAYPLIAGPTLLVNPPVKQENGLVLISGETKRVSGVWINELPIPITEEGVFAVERAYPRGYTVVTIRALDRFGREREETLTFVTKENYASQEKGSEKRNEESSEKEDGEGTTEGGQNGSNS